MEMRPFEGKALLALSNPSPSIQAYEGSVRSGKTITSLIDWLRFIRYGPPGNLLMTGRTERTIINNLLLPLQDMLGASRVKISYGQGKVSILGRDVLLVGANNEQARTKIQGLTLVGAYCDELSTLPESFFNMLYSRLSVEGAKLWFTSNPEGPAHWLKVNWLDKAKLWVDGQGKFHHNKRDDAKDLHRFTFLLDDNPSLPASYIERTKRSYSGLFYRRYILAEWVAADGAVFPMWDPQSMVIPWEDLPRMHELISVGIDYGTENPTAALLLGIAREFDAKGNLTGERLYLVDEWRTEKGHNLTDAQLSRKLRDWLSERHLPKQDLEPRHIICDPSALSFKKQLYMDGVENLVNADNDVAYGIRTMASLLGTGNLLVSDRCEGLINEIGGYSWDDKASQKGEDKPMKVQDHSVDAARYAITTTESVWLDRVNI